MGGTGAGNYGQPGVGWLVMILPKTNRIVREWLSERPSDLRCSYEVQNNIISKNVLGLLETTQKDRQWQR